MTKLPPRYQINWRGTFAEQYAPFLRQEMTILDIGSGRKPTIAIADRPLGTTYIGLDISAEELAKAGPGDYDESIVGDVAVTVPELIDSIDLAVSWQVLEHVESLQGSLDAVYSYLRPGGAFVALLSGKNAHFAVINRLIPEAIGKKGMKNLLGRPPDTVFRAHYDSCTASAIQESMTDWTEVTVIPHFRGAEYFGFFRPLQSLYLAYENWAMDGNRKNLATHYTLVAVK